MWNVAHLSIQLSPCCPITLMMFLINSLRLSVRMDSVVVRRVSQRSWPLTGSLTTVPEPQGWTIRRQMWRPPQAVLDQSTPGTRTILRTGRCSLLDQVLPTSVFFPTECCNVFFQANAGNKHHPSPFLLTFGLLQKINSVSNRGLWLCLSVL